MSEIKRIFPNVTVKASNSISVLNKKIWNDIMCLQKIREQYRYNEYKYNRTYNIGEADNASIEEGDAK